MQIRTPNVSKVRPLRFLLPAGLLALIALEAGAATFTVNSAADVHDAFPNDGVCETAKDNHVCTLRAAIEQANALDGADTIQLQANTTYLLSLTSALGSRTADLIISDSVTIAGAGIDSTIIDGNGMATGTRVIYVIQCIRDDCTSGSVTVNISGTTITHGMSADGAAGINSDGILNLDHVKISDNSTPDSAGGLFGQTLNISNSIIANNSAGSNGGGIYARGATTISNTTISDNKTSGTSSRGGGLLVVNSSTLVIGSTISGNSAAVGGGVYHSVGTLTLINTTISGNASTGSGGGVYNAGGVAGLYNVTVTENGANADETGFDAGGGIYNASGQAIYAANSIISGNTLVIPTAPFPTLGSDECGGTITSFGYNILVSVDPSHCTVSGPYSSADPLLGPLQFNGGSTRTHALPLGSPAIDGGNPGGCTDQVGAPITTDQRGIHRPSGTHCDVGAFESDDIIFKNGFQAP